MRSQIRSEFLVLGKLETLQAAYALAKQADGVLAPSTYWSPLTVLLTLGVTIAATRLAPGATSLRSCKTLVASSTPVKNAIPVTLRPGRA